MIDPINPDHYRHGQVECIEAIKAALGRDGFMAYCRGQMMKYIWRAEHKGSPAVDYRKAEWYANRLVLELELANE
jgi:hypothetical protein